MSASKTTILVVDNDKRTQFIIKHILELDGYRVITASDGNAAIRVFANEIPDLIILDVVLPSINGFDVCSRIREFSELPIIIVTSKDSEADKIKGLDAGADDYITKPFMQGEVLARVRAVLRRTRFWDETPVPAFHLDDLVIDFTTHRVTIDGDEKRLTATEYRLLSYMAKHKGYILTPDAILKNVWGEGYFGDIHLLQSTMARLRTKLGDNPKDPKYICTRPGMGYTMNQQQ
jgi:two-component system response regulator VicR